MPYNLVVPPRAYSDQEAITYRFYGGRNRPGRLVMCTLCRKERWVPLENVSRSSKCWTCKLLSPKTCLQCGKVFKPTSYIIQCCSRKCSDIRRTKPKPFNAKPPRKRYHPLYTKTECANCNNEFKHYTRDQRKFCSPSCSNNFNKKFGLANPAFKNSVKPKHYDRLMSAKWRALAKSIRKRDGHKCFVCHPYKWLRRLPVHHIIPVSDGGDDRPENLVSLCTSCHRKIENRVDIRPLLLWLVSRAYGY